VVVQVSGFRDKGCKQAGLLREYQRMDLGTVDTFRYYLHTVCTYVLGETIRSSCFWCPRGACHTHRHRCGGGFCVVLNYVWCLTGFLWASWCGCIQRGCGSRDACCAHHFDRHRWVPKIHFASATGLSWLLRAVQSKVIWSQIRIWLQEGRVQRGCHSLEGRRAGGAHHTHRHRCAGWRLW
jgi:hypothetical protein